MLVSVGFRWPDSTVQSRREIGRLMKLLLRMWLPVYLVLAAVLAVILFVNWSDFPITLKLSFAVAIAIILHMLEEEKLPGGGSGISSTWAEARARLLTAIR